MIRTVLPIYPNAILLVLGKKYEPIGNVLLSLTEKYDRMDAERLDYFKKLVVKKDCELREFIEIECKLPFKRGCAFYEFIHEIESIPEYKEVMLMKEVSLISLCTDFL